MIISKARSAEAARIDVMEKVVEVNGLGTQSEVLCYYSPHHSRNVVFIPVSFVMRFRTGDLTLV